MNKKTTNPARKSVFLKGSWPRSREKGKKKDSNENKEPDSPEPSQGYGVLLEGAQRGSAVNDA